MQREREREWAAEANPRCSCASSCVYSGLQLLNCVIKAISDLVGRVIPPTHSHNKYRPTGYHMWLNTNDFGGKETNILSAYIVLL